MVTKEQLEKRLNNLNKANKDVKLKWANNAGFDTVEEYKAHLETQISIRSKADITTPRVTSTPPVETATSKDKIVDYVIAFDTTGSMNRYIESVKFKVHDLIEDLFKNIPNLRMSIVAFGDYCDMTSPKEFGIAYQVSPLMDDKAKLIEFTKSAKNTSGGDGDEFYELVIKKITEETEWRAGSDKTVLLIADYTPHPIGYNIDRHNQNHKTRNVTFGTSQIDWRAEAIKSKELGIKWDTLKIIPAHTWYDELSTITGGISLNFANASKVDEVITATNYARHGVVEEFSMNMSKAVASGDAELIGMYKQASTLL